MTQELKAGRELDALVAEKAMGQKRTGDCGLDDPDCPGRYEPTIGRWPCLPPYSTHIEAAWEIVNYLNGLGVVITADQDWSGFWVVKLNFPLPKDDIRKDDFYGSWSHYDNEMRYKEFPLALSSSALLLTKDPAWEKLKQNGRP